MEVASNSKYDFQNRVNSKYNINIAQTYYFLHGTVNIKIVIIDDKNIAISYWKLFQWELCLACI